MNFLISKTLESQVKKQLDKALLGDFDVQIQPFGGLSMLQGKFRRIVADSPYINLEGFYLSNVHGESLCDYNHFVYSYGNVYTAENFIISFSAEATSLDLQKLVETPQYKKLINSLNINVGGMSVFKVFEPQVTIENNRILLLFKYFSPMTMKTPKDLKAYLSIYAQDGQIMFGEMEFVPSLSSINMRNLLPIINKLNPLVYNTNILNNENSFIKVTSLDFIDNKIVIKGLVIVPKNYYNN